MKRRCKIISPYIIFEIKILWTILPIPKYAVGSYQLGSNILPLWQQILTLQSDGYSDKKMTDITNLAIFLQPNKWGNKFSS